MLSKLLQQGQYCTCHSLSHWMHPDFVLHNNMIMNELKHFVSQHYCDADLF